MNCVVVWVYLIGLERFSLETVYHCILDIRDNTNCVHDHENQPLIDKIGVVIFCVSAPSLPLYHLNTFGQ